MFVRSIYIYIYVSFLSSIPALPWWMAGGITLPSRSVFFCVSPSWLHDRRIEASTWILIRRMTSIEGGRKAQPPTKRKGEKKQKNNKPLHHFFYIYTYLFLNRAPPTYLCIYFRETVGQPWIAVVISHKDIFYKTIENFAFLPFFRPRFFLFLFLFYFYFTCATERWVTLQSNDDDDFKFPPFFLSSSTTIIKKNTHIYIERNQFHQNGRQQVVYNSSCITSIKKQ